MSDHPLDKAEVAYVVEPAVEGDEWVAWRWGKPAKWEAGDTPGEAVEKMRERDRATPTDEGEEA